MSFTLILKNEENFANHHCCEAMGEQGNYEWLNVDSYLLGSTNHRIYWSSEYNLIFNINSLKTASEIQTKCWMPFKILEKL